MSIDRHIRIAILYDFYAPLLTERQRVFVERHFLEDLSLGEIADEYGVSRQAVHDTLLRAERILVRAEEQLGFASRYESVKDRIRRMAAKLAEVESDLRTGESREGCRAASLDPALDKLKGVLEDLNSIIETL